MNDPDEELRSLAYKNKRLYGCLIRLKNYYLGEDFRVPVNQLDAAMTITEEVIKLHPKEK